MKQILVSTMVLATLGALVVSGTVALFSDQESILGNTVSTGTLELTLNKTAGKPFTVSDGYPGYTTDWEYMDIFNTGTMPFEAYLTFEKTAGDQVLFDALKIRLHSAGGDSFCDTGDDTLIYDGFIKDFSPQTLISNYWHLANEEDGSGVPADNIRAGWTMRVCQKLSIDSGAGNEIMGKTVTFSEIVDAMQDND